MAGEFGHAKIDEDGLECRCGNKGCWEVYASNSAAVRYYSQSASPVRSGKATSRSVGQALTFDHLLRLTEQSDPKAVEAINEISRYPGARLPPLWTALPPPNTVLLANITCTT